MTVVSPTASGAPAASAAPAAPFVSTPPAPPSPAASPAAGAIAIDPEFKARLQVLVVDDDRTLRESCASLLRHDGFTVTVCGRGEDARELLRRRPWDIVLLDLYMSQVPGMELLRTALATRRETLVIMVTGNPSVETSVETLRAGAWDYLPKPFSATQLQVLIGRAAHTIVVARETAAEEEALADSHGNSDKLTVLGSAPAFRRAIEIARRVAGTDASVFVTGESGTGKELIAQFIHRHSRRSSRPLVAVNCAALPEPLLESEMFGHTKGAFTGAVRDKPGLLETANGGTMFLDELIEMPKSIQAKLLRVIQDGVVRRVGSETTDAVVNVRFIAATNMDPEAAVASGALREDLYYRLRVVPIHVPSLRERPEDIPVLAGHFLTHYWRRHRERGLDVPRLSEAAVRALRAHPFRGNVRELQNIIEHAVVMLEPGAEVTPEDLAVQPPANPAPYLPAADVAVDTGVGYHEARERVIAAFERRYLDRVLELGGGNMSKAARIAGVDRTTLYRLMERHGLGRAVDTAPVPEIPGI